MKREKLKQAAARIGNVPAHYQMDAEDYEDERALFWWSDKGNEDSSIMVELELNGQLKSLSRPAPQTDQASLPSEEIEKRMLSFTDTHYPGAAAEFVREENRAVCEDKVRYSYVQMADGLPLPFTGFYIHLSLTGEVIEFCYHGKADGLMRPGQIADKQEAMAHFVKDIDVELFFSVLHRSVYEQGDDKPHLIYETVLPSLPISADLKEEKKEYDDIEDDTPQRFPLSPLEDITDHIDVNHMIGLHAGFHKVRESDLGDGRIGMAWRHEETEPARADKSLMSLFEQRTNQVLKTIHHKKSGKLAGVMSFMREEGAPVLSEAECENIALRFLFAMFPEADEFFQIQYDEPDDEQENAGFTFKAEAGGVPIRFGESRICVSKKTGRISFYMPPEIDPAELRHIDPVPSLTKEEAKAAILEAIRVELAWDRHDDGSGQNTYRLVYKPIYPHIIEAHTGRAIMSSIG
ncbi:hydrolase [Bacillus nakamurai]|uniref:YcdB/YcdC domain-containing protein n=1 Tax=Bacillus nakamurai TaxID=1793963 RepID=UPI00077822E8|nr:YcdB/YcdC domain-containing protein [Bacillus nakamurai]KXZ20734.1 hydrolase [Bacillus nakamurai]